MHLSQDSLSDMVNGRIIELQVCACMCVCLRSCACAYVCVHACVTVCTRACMHVCLRPRLGIASNAMTRIQTIFCFSVGAPSAALSPLAIRFECVQILVFC